MYTWHALLNQSLTGTHSQQQNPSKKLCHVLDKHVLSGPAASGAGSHPCHLCPTCTATVHNIFVAVQTERQPEQWAEHPAQPKASLRSGKTSTQQQQHTDSTNQTTLVLGDVPGLQGIQCP